MFKVLIKLNSMTNIIVNMNDEQLKQFKTNKQIFTWLTLNKYTDDLKDETEININNITSIVYQPIQE